MYQPPLAITPAMFVAAWRQSSSLQEVSDRLRIAPHEVQERAVRYRRSGMRLEPLEGEDRPD